MVLAGQRPFAPGATLVGMKAAPPLAFGCASAAVRVALVMHRVWVMKVVPAGASCWFGRNTAVCDPSPPSDLLST